MKKISGLLLSLIISLLFITACNSTIEFSINFEVDGVVYETVSTVGNTTISMPADPEKDGYIFDGWYWDKNTWNRPFTANSLLDEKLTENMTVYAKWKEKITPIDDYLISAVGFESDGNNLHMTVSNSTINYSFINQLNFIEGVTFSVALDINGNQIIQSKNINLNIGDNLVYILAKANNDTVALYNAEIRRRPLYEISFSDGIETQTIEEDSIALIPDEPTKIGYVFDKWLYNGTEYDFDTPVTSNMNIIANWIANTNTLIFHGNGATSGSMNNQLIDTDITANLSVNAFIKDGYTFIGWSTTKDGAVEYADEASYVMGIESSYTLYAIWQANTNTLIYNGNGSTRGSMENIAVETDEIISLNINTYEREGYTFMGWSTTEGGEVEYADEASYTMGILSSYTLYAVWQANTNQIIFNGNGATSGSMENITADTEEIITLDINTYIREGYTFIGWSTISDGTVQYDDEASYIMGTENSYTLYAVWQANTNQIIFNGNGATSGSMNNQLIDTDDTANLSANAFIKDGYTFIGWSTTEDGEVEYANEANYTMGTESSYTLYAVWQANTNTLIFDGNDATSGNMNNQLIDTDDIVNLAANTYYKDGYTFIGWSTTEDGTVEYADKVSYTMGTESSYTLYAVWQANTNTLIYNGNGSTRGSMENIAVETDEIISLNINTYEREGYTFMGWSTTEGGEVEYADEASYTMGILSSYTLYAVWQANTNQIIFNGNGATSGSMENQLVNTDDSANLNANAFFKEGYTFIGWSTAEDEEVEYADEVRYTMGTLSSYTLYAVWSINQYKIIFITNGGSYVPNIIQNYGTIVQESITSKVGYTFEGWFTDNDTFCNEYSIITMPAENIVLYAYWKLYNEGLLFTSINNNTAYSVSRGNNEDDHIVIPTEYNGLMVESINDRAFENNYALYSIDIPSSINCIGSYAFQNCTNLTSITIPDSVTSIGLYAFSGCSNLTSITIPRSVTSIVSGTFSGCSNLTNITIPDSVTSIGSSAFEGSNLISITIPDKVTSIGIWAFSNCKNLATVIIPDSLISIGERTFNRCSSLTNIFIPSNVTNIGYDAFYDCSNLTHIEVSEDNIYYKSIDGVLFDKEEIILMQYPIGNNRTEYTIPDSVTSIVFPAFAGSRNLISLNFNENSQLINIGSSTFIGSSLTNINIPSNVTSIGSYAFQNCNSLTSIIIPDSVTNIGDPAFWGCSSLKSVNIPYAVTSIGHFLFSGCSSLTSITIPNSVTSIGSYAFSGCNSLTSIIIPDSVTSIGNYAFLYCSSLTSIVIPDSVTSIGNSAFRNCSSLTSIVIPDSVTSIGSDAFYGCSSLTSITIESETPPTLDGSTLGGNTFYNTPSSLKIYVPSSSVNTYKSSSGWSYYSNKIYSQSIIDENGFAIDSGVLIQYIGDATEITIPSSATSIDNRVFYNFRSLKSIIIPDSVTSIGDDAFIYCSSLTSITIGNSVTSIGEEAFYNCSSLTSVTIESETPPTLGTSALIKTHSLLKIYVPSESVDAYKSASGWSSYSSKIYAIS